ncbi:hypothetical protein EAO76_26070 [Streptomyces sp. sk2.1]|nr:hypothetical protein EAO76_26070 [Streptomyces sp. sk2.1]
MAQGQGFEPLRHEPYTRQEHEPHTRQESDTRRKDSGCARYSGTGTTTDPLRPRGSGASLDTGTPADTCRHTEHSM